MKFGPVRVEDAEGALLAHATTAGDRRFRKAHRLTAEDIAFLKSAGIREVVALSCPPTISMSTLPLRVSRRPCASAAST